MEPIVKPRGIETTLAAVLEKTGEPLIVKRIRLPQLKPGQLLVKVLFSGVCRSQLMESRGQRGPDRWLPHLLGHEGSGIVMSIGPGVCKVKPGDSVILTWIKGEGLNAPGAIYHDGNFEINSGPITTFSEYTVVSENRVVLKPPALEFDCAVLFGCALPTGVGMVINELNISLSDSVVVLGLGGIGISALMALLARGVKQVVAVDVSVTKLTAAKQWGVKHCLNSRDEDAVKRVHEITNGGADFCIESAGRVDTIEQGFAMIRKGGGRLLFASHPPEGELIRLAPHDLISGKHIAGSWGGGINPDRDVPRIHTLLSGGDIPLNALLTKRYPLTKINDALNDLAQGSVFRPLIEMHLTDQLDSNSSNA
jgi:S-(hydroxymethyl)glutathione dehydrogenase/alcohol dehydrogenase